MKKRRGIEMTLAQAQQHQAKHGFSSELVQGATLDVGLVAGRIERLPTPVKMTRPEKEYGLILEAMKRRKEVQDYRFQGMSLAWGKDPESGILMRYKCDYVVFLDSWQRVRIIECKGAHIWPKDLIRFKGCRAEWPMFQFEMHQLEKGVWRRVQ